MLLVAALAEALARGGEEVRHCIAGVEFQHLPLLASSAKNASSGGGGVRGSLRNSRGNDDDNSGGSHRHTLDTAQMVHLFEKTYAKQRQRRIRPCRAQTNGSNAWDRPCLFTRRGPTDALPPEALAYMARQAERSALVVAAYEWSPDALVGNEYWDRDCATATVPSAMRQSTIAELHNPHINTFIDPCATRVYGV
jgi:hypothetical protein